MAVKFSQFTTGATLADIDYFVGYQGTDNVQIPKALLTGTTYTVDVPTGTESINLAGSDGSNDAITLTSGTGMTITRVSDSELSFAASGDSYTLKALAKTGSSVPIQLDATLGADSQVSLTEGAGITLTQNSATEITVAATATGTTVTKEQFTGNNSTTVFTLSTSTSTDNINIFISGVYQNSKDSTGAANYAVTSGTTLTFTTAPPTTATNGIEVVITQ